MNRQQHQLMSILQKIPVFEGLSLEQAEHLIRICRFQKYAANTQIYTAGDVSDDFLVLIMGKLTVLSPAGQKLVELGAGVSIGEMGVFTGHMRSATVVAEGDCAGLVIARELIYQLMEGDQHIKASILGNVVAELSDRLAEANGKVDALMSAVQKHEADATAAKEQLAEAQLAVSDTEPELPDEDSVEGNGTDSSDEVADEVTEGEESSE